MQKPTVLLSWLLVGLLLAPSLAAPRLDAAIVPLASAGQGVTPVTGKVFELVAIQVVIERGQMGQVSDTTHGPGLSSASDTYTRQLSLDYHELSVGTANLTQSIAVTYPQRVEVGQPASFSATGSFTAATQGMSPDKQGWWSRARMSVWGNDCRNNWVTHEAEPFPINTTASWSGRYHCNFVFPT